jgi:hypothetical protein
VNLNDLLTAKKIDPRLVLAMRHRPKERELRHVLPWLVAEKPKLFNAYQQTQSESVEPAMQSLAGKGYIASFIAYGPGRALFVGLYSIGQYKPLTPAQFAAVPEYVELKALSHSGFSATKSRQTILYFDLKQLDFYSDWSGKLIVDWPPPERSWWRRAHRNDIAIRAIAEESELERAISSWDELDLSWAELQIIPRRVREVLSQWRGIYYIFDTSVARGYVGSAYGESNILGRWLNYAATGDGGNTLLRKRDPSAFRFTILQRLSPDTDPADVIRVENTWKERLHTRAPHGLNDN